MTIKAEAQHEAAVAGRIGGRPWWNMGAEVWEGRNRLFDAKDAKRAEHIARLHNLIIPVSNLLTRALKEVQDLRKLMQIRRGI